MFSCKNARGYIGVDLSRVPPVPSLAARLGAMPVPNPAIPPGLHRILHHPHPNSLKTQGME